MMKRTFHCIIVCTLIILSTLHISKNGTIIYDNNSNFDTYNSLTPNWYYKVLR